MAESLNGETTSECHKKKPAEHLSSRNSQESRQTRKIQIKEEGKGDQNLNISHDEEQAILEHDELLNKDIMYWEAMHG